MAESKHQIEPGVLTAFRLFLGVEWALQALGIVALAHRRELRFDITLLLNWIESSTLLLYLLWVWLRAVLGRVYLPLALTVACVGPVIWQVVGTASRIRRGIHGAAALVDPSTLYVWLLLPLVLIAAQYGVRAALLATTGTSLLSTLLALPLARTGEFDIAPQVTSAFSRLLIFSAAGVLVALLSKAQRNYRQELARKQERLAQYALTMEQLAVSRERNRLARELHDTLAHTLSAVSVQLKAIDTLWMSEPDAARGMLQQTQDLTRAGLDEARRALHELRAHPLDTLGLAAAIRQAAERAASRAGAQLEFVASPDQGRMPLEIEQQIYRIAEEALNNIAQHAKAAHMWVTLERDATRLTLLARDDGVGFDSARQAEAGHFGVTGMRERAQLIGATFELRSAPGAGVTVRVVAPLAAQ